MLPKQTQLYWRFSGHQVEDLKQLRVGQGRGTGPYVYHISLPNILVASTAHFKHDEQERWIDGICLRCDGLALMMSHSTHRRSYQDALCKASHVGSCIILTSHKVLDNPVLRPPPREDKLSFPGHIKRKIRQRFSAVKQCRACKKQKKGKPWAEGHSSPDF